MAGSFWPNSCARPFRADVGRGVKAFHESTYRRTVLTITEKHDNKRPYRAQHQQRQEDQLDHSNVDHDTLQLPIRSATIDKAGTRIKTRLLVQRQRLVYRNASKARLSKRTLTRGSPMMPAERCSILAPTRERMRSSLWPRALATAGTCANAY